jgi:hypothetical protein
MTWGLSAAEAVPKGFTQRDRTGRPGTCRPPHATIRPHTVLLRGPVVDLRPARLPDAGSSLGLLTLCFVVPWCVGLLRVIFTASILFASHPLGTVWSFPVYVSWPSLK